MRDICFRSDSDLWIGTEQGLYIYNIETDEYEHLTTPDIDERYALSDNAIYRYIKIVKEVCGLVLILAD